MIFNKIANYLKQPAPTSRRPWMIVLASSLIVFLLLSLAVRINTDSKTRLFIIIGFTLITTVSTSLMGYVFPLLFRNFYSPRNWTIGKSFLNNIITILIICLGNFIFDLFIFDHTPQSLLSIFLSYLLITILIGLIPLTVATLLVQNSELKHNLREAKEWNRQINSHSHEKEVSINPESELTTITLTGNTKESIDLSPDSVLYIESSGNYVIINYLNEQIVKQKQLRATIGQMESDLKSYSPIVRCHRAFLVNTSHIISAEGNSQGLHLNLTKTSNEIPVSRSYVKEIRNKLSN